mmetsp:Transcript_7147/g.17768  ORF Transcript_7147/g.17768 Transcript_7147/m.17768 type:complete len:204 (-) Transcript_7147:501-1112(-)
MFDVGPTAAAAREEERAPARVPYRPPEPPPATIFRPFDVVAKYDVSCIPSADLHLGNLSNTFFFQESVMSSMCTSGTVAASFATLSLRLLFAVLLVNGCCPSFFGCLPLFWAAFPGEPTFDIIHGGIMIERGPPSEIIVPGGGGIMPGGIPPPPMANAMCLAMVSSICRCPHHPSRGHHHAVRVQGMVLMLLLSDVVICVVIF